MGTSNGTTHEENVSPKPGTIETDPNYTYDLEGTCIDSTQGDTHSDTDPSTINPTILLNHIVGPLIKEVHELKESVHSNYAKLHTNYSRLEGIITTQQQVITKLETTITSQQ